MKILITGGAGFIGSHLAEKLLKQDNEVFVLDNLSTGSKDNIKHLMENPNFHFKEGSVLDEELVNEMVQGKDQVYHLAAAVGVKTILEKPLFSLLTNIKGTEIVLGAADKNKAKVLIVSSSEVSGKGKMPENGFKEDDDRTYGSVYNDRWVYAFSKAVDEFLAIAYFKEKGLQAVAVRLFNVVGPRQSGSYGMVLPIFVKQALDGKEIVVFGTGEQTRSFGDVEDVTDGLLALMNRDDLCGKLFNLGADYEISMNNLAKKVKELTQSQAEIKHISYEQAYPKGYEDFKERRPDLTKIKQAIGYVPKVSLDESIKRIVEYQRSLGQ